MASTLTETAAPGATRPSMVLAVACLCQLMVVLDISVVNVALPQIGRALEFSAGGLSWVVNAYTLAFGGLLLLGGRIADLFGHRRTMLAALALFGIASTLGGLARNAAELVAARAGQGLAAAVLAPVTLTVIMVTFAEGAARQKAIATWAMVAVAGSAIGVLLSGVLVEYLDWRWVLFVNIPIVVAALPLAAAAIRDVTRRGRARLDVVGAVLVTASMTLLAYGTVHAGQHGWATPATVVTLSGAATAGAGFGWWETRVAAVPLVRFAIFRARTVWVADALVLFIGAATVAGFYFASLYLQSVAGYSPVRTGLAFLPFCAGITAGTVLSGRLTSRFGARAVLSGGLLLGGSGLLGFALLDVGSGFGDFLWPSLLASVGIGACMVTNTTMGTSGVQPSEAGLVSGLLNTSRQVGGSIALAVLATVASATTGSGGDGGSADAVVAGRHALAVGYSHAFVLGGVLVLVAAAVAAAFVPRRH